MIFRQSDVAEHAELALLLGMVTPLSSLFHNPTWKEQLVELAKNKHAGQSLPERAEGKILDDFQKLGGIVKLL